MSAVTAERLAARATSGFKTDDQCSEERDEYADTDPEVNHDLTLLKFESRCCRLPGLLGARAESLTFRQLPPTSE